MGKKLEEAKWRDLLSEIENNVTAVSYRTWFLPLTPVEIDEKGKTISFACGESFKIEVLKKRYIPVLEAAVKKVFGQSLKIVLLNKTEDEVKESLQGDQSPVSIANTEDNNSFKDEFYLNPRQNFDNFVVGPNNDYAYMVSLAVAESPAEAYNPLFIYGGSGLGKTHLMHAIGHHVMKHFPDKKVLYVSSEMFTNELINALGERRDRRNNEKLNIFKQKYRSVDVLLIDDIQFIEDKKGIQNELDRKSVV